MASKKKTSNARKGVAKAAARASEVEIKRAWDAFSDVIFDSQNQTGFSSAFDALLAFTDDAETSLKDQTEALESFLTKKISSLGQNFADNVTKQYERYVQQAS